MHDKLNAWYAGKVLRKTSIELSCMSAEEVNKLDEWVQVKVSTDKFWNEIYSAYRDWKTIAQIVIQPSQNHNKYWPK